MTVEYLRDARIDLEGLLALDAAWSARGDTFDASVDSAATIWEVITRIARAGRAVPYYQGGMVRFHRDAPQTAPLGMYTSSNIVLDSLSMDFALPVSGQSADGVTGEYYDDRTWLPSTVTAGVDGGTPAAPAREQLYGIVDASQAAREVAYMAAANRYRRAFITFRTELDGLIPSVGDLILVAHDLPRWGISGNVVAWNATTRVMTLDRDVTLGGGSNTIRLRSATGVPSASVLITAGPAANQVTLAAAPTAVGGGAFAVVLTGRQEPTHYAIGTSAEVARQAVVSGIVPRGSTVEIRAVIEDSRVHVN